MVDRRGLDFETQRETLVNFGITMEVFRDARANVREKAMEHLV